MSGFGYVELGPTWGPWYGADFEENDNHCRRLRDLSLAALKLWSSYAAKTSDPKCPHAELAKQRACRLMIYYSGRWAARRRELAAKAEIPAQAA